MITVASLLNPVEPASAYNAVSPAQHSRHFATTFRSLERSRMPNPDPVPVKAATVGKVRYPPCEIQDEAIKREHQKYQVQDPASIKLFPRHIPYNSDKKSFHERTGREAFEAFHYCFRVPGQPADKPSHVVMWDYNVGLVRITALFKSLKHPKTMPAKVMTSNPGLKDISHSITGGSISAQGYWIPYDAARAIAAKFCWDIRYVLTPVFGADFPDSCLRPEHPHFLKLGVDKAVVGYSTTLANRFHADMLSRPEGSLPRDASTKTMKSTQPKVVIKSDYESGYGTDPDRGPLESPKLGAHGWTAINDAEMVNSRSKSSHISTRPLDAVNGVQGDNTISDHGHKRPRSIDDDDGRSPDPRGRPISQTPAAQHKQYPSKAAEARAAYALVALHKADITFAERSKSLGRRGSDPGPTRQTTKEDGLKGNAQLRDT